MSPAPPVIAMLEPGDPVHRPPPLCQRRIASPLDSTTPHHSAIITAIVLVAVTTSAIGDRFVGAVGEADIAGAVHHARHLSESRRNAACRPRRSPPRPTARAPVDGACAALEPAERADHRPAPRPARTARRTIRPPAGGRAARDRRRPRRRSRPANSSRNAVQVLAGHQSARPSASATPAPTTARSRRARRRC